MEHGEVGPWPLASEPEPGADDRPARQILPETWSTEPGEWIGRPTESNRTAVYVIRMHGGVGGGGPVRVPPIPIRRRSSHHAKLNLEKLGVNIQDTFTVASIASVAVSAVTALVTLIISLLKWQTALKEQIRRVQLESARLACELANELHEGPVAAYALELIDGESSRVVTPQHGNHEVTDTELRNALTIDPDQPASSEKDAAIRHTIDSMFYVFDRIRCGIGSKLISKNDLSGATIYYCKKLVRTHGYVLDYGMIVYPEAVSFIKTLSAASTINSTARNAA